MRGIRIITVAAVCMLAACAKDDKSAADTATTSAAAAGTAGTAGAPGTAGSTGAAAGQAAAGTGLTAANNCLLGTWNNKEAGFTKTFTFNEDGTGQEVQSRSDTRSFTWSMKNENTVHVTYTTQGAAQTEWDLNIDCKNNRFASLYTK